MGPGFHHIKEKVQPPLPERQRTGCEATAPSCNPDIRGTDFAAVVTNGRSAFCVAAVSLSRTFAASANATATPCPERALYGHLRIPGRCPLWRGEPTLARSVEGSTLRTNETSMGAISGFLYYDLKTIAPSQGAAQIQRASRSASRNASATAVRVGFAQLPVGNTEDPAMKRFSIPCTLPSRSTTPLEGSDDMRVVPM